MEALEAIRTRRSVRSYISEPLTRETLETLVDAGRLAATGCNVQPWAFVVATDRDMLERLASHTENGRFINEAPACVAVFCEDTKYYIEDGCAATQNILVAAAALGLGSCWVAGDKKPYAETVRQMLGMPKDFKLVSLIAVGRPRLPIPSPTKRELNAVLHWETYGGGEPAAALQ